MREGKERRREKGWERKHGGRDEKRKGKKNYLQLLEIRIQVWN